MQRCQCFARERETDRERERGANGKRGGKAKEEREVRMPPGMWPLHNQHIPCRMRMKTLNLQDLMRNEASMLQVEEM